MTSRGFESVCLVVFWSWSLWLKKCSNPGTTSPTLPLSSHAVTLRGSTTWLMQVSLAYAWSAVASAFIVVFESLMGVGGHQNAPPTSLSASSRQLHCSSQREERAGSVFVVVFLQSLFTELSADSSQHESARGKTTRWGCHLLLLVVHIQSVGKHKAWEAAWGTVGGFFTLFSTNFVYLHRN